MVIQAEGRALRIEDRRFVTGEGRYIDDLRPPGCLTAAFLRSPHAHACIVRVDTRAASRMPGVQLVLTGHDLAAAGIKPLQCVMHPPPKPGTALRLPDHWPLATDRARHVGEPVAIVVAEMSAQALDAVEAIEVEYEDLPAVVDADMAMTAAAPWVHDSAPGNLCVIWEKGDAQRVAQALAEAAHVTALTVRNNRLASCPLEPRAAIADYDARLGRLNLITPSQGVHEMRTLLAHSLNLAETELHVVTPDVGGSFGTKMYPYPETVAVLAAAQELQRPVAWTASRAESFMSDNQARDVVSTGELALDVNGHFSALRVRSTANMGAYLSGFGPYIPTEVGTRALVGPYATPAIHVEVKAAFSNTVPVDAYRGAGRPEAAYLVERLVDKAARETGIGRLELRRRNLIGPQALPYDTPLGFRYDSGDFPAVMEAAVAAADWRGFPARRRDGALRRRLRGIGIATFVEPAGGDRNQRVELRVNRDATLTVVTGSQSTGMGHETMLARLVADRLAIAEHRVQVLQGDSDLVAFGRWTSGSRTAVVAGTALWHALDRMLDKAGHVAASLMQAPVGDVRFSAGMFRVDGTGRAVAFDEVAVAAFDRRVVPAGMELGLDQSVDEPGRLATFPNGCHICEVEVDRETGAAEILRYVAVDDVGRALEPEIVEGQMHGSLAQGIGQAMLESCRYDLESGQLVSGSLMDYALPRADDLPAFDSTRVEVPCRTNPLGAKGAGESGTVGAPPAVVSALLDALAPEGVTDIETPATAERIWRAIRQAESVPRRR